MNNILLLNAMFIFFCFYSLPFYHPISIVLYAEWLNKVCISKYKLSNTNGLISKVCIRKLKGHENTRKVKLKKDTQIFGSRSQRTPKIQGKGVQGTLEILFLREHCLCLMHVNKKFVCTLLES